MGGTFTGNKQLFRPYENTDLRGTLTHFFDGAGGGGSEVIGSRAAAGSDGDSVRLHVLHSQISQLTAPLTQQLSYQVSQSQQ